jgi:hypothetical protein
MLADFVPLVFLGAVLPDASLLPYSDDGSLRPYRDIIETAFDSLPAFVELPEDFVPRSHNPRVSVVPHGNSFALTSLLHPFFAAPF